MWKTGDFHSFFSTAFSVEHTCAMVLACSFLGHVLIMSRHVTGNCCQKWLPAAPRFIHGAGGISLCHAWWWWRTWQAAAVAGTPGNASTSQHVSFGG